MGVAGDAFLVSQLSEGETWLGGAAAQGHGSCSAGGTGRNKRTGQKKRAEEGFEEEKKERRAMMTLLSCSSGIL